MAKIEMTDCTIKTVNDICAKFGNKPGELINVLHETQNTLGYLPQEVQKIVASNLDIPLVKVYGVVSFYSFFTMQPKGEHPISLCLGTACYVRGSENVLREFEKELGIQVGQVTPDGKFSLDCLRCLGCCGLAPVCMIGEKVYGRLEPKMVKDILAEY
jgi:NADP-reducing hydrogenase subunit HndA